MNLRQAAQRALKAMEVGEWRADMVEFSDALIALRAALAEPEQEPVASLMTNIQSGDQKVVWNDDGFDRALWHETPLYTAPISRKPLTYDELEPLCEAFDSYDTTQNELVEFARAIERAHGIGDSHE